MRPIPVERERPGTPWWTWLIPLLLVALFVAIAIPLALAFDTDTDQVPPVTDEAAEPGATPADDELNLNNVIANTGLPQTFQYGGLTWQAVEAGRFRLEGRDLIAIGPEIGGNELYYEQGTPTNPYQTLYLRGATEGYRNVYVMYRPVNE